MVVANRKQFDLTVEVAVVHCRSKPYVYSFTHRPVLNSIKYDDDIRTNNFRFLPAILDNQETMESSAVGRCRVHAASSVTPFRLWNDISIFCNGQVISTSDLPPR